VADAPHFLGVHLIPREAPGRAGWLELYFAQVCFISGDAPNRAGG